MGWPADSSFLRCASRATGDAAAANATGLGNAGAAPPLLPPPPLLLLLHGYAPKRVGLLIARGQGWGGGAPPRPHTHTHSAALKMGLEAVHLA
jgi:hypothetical protein